jgi:hypothetical protein
MGRTLTIIAIALAVATTTISVAASVYFSTTAKATPVAAPTPTASPTPSPTPPPPPPPPLRDYWTQTKGKAVLPAAAKRMKQVLVMTLPAGRWVLHADLSVYNKGPSDFVGCVIGATGTQNLNAHHTIVGDPTVKGNVGAGPLMAIISETAAVTTKTSTQVFVKCEHDNAHGSAPYIDAGADLWAHQSAYLVKLGA